MCIDAHQHFWHIANGQGRWPRPALSPIYQHPKFKGLRPMLSDLADDPGLDPAVQSMLDHRLGFDALVLPHQLPALRAFALRHSRLPIVIDHAARPVIARGSMLNWQREIAALAELPNVHCKLSGLRTDAGPGCSELRLQPCVEHVFACFGARRLMWGCDWPVLRLAAGYDEWFTMARSPCEAQSGMHPDDLNAEFGGNAHRFYRLHFSPNRRGFPC